jgi:hypothetical protein
VRLVVALYNPEVTNVTFGGSERKGGFGPYLHRRVEIYFREMNETRTFKNFVKNAVQYDEPSRTLYDDAQLLPNAEACADAGHNNPSQYLGRTEYHSIIAKETIPVAGDAISVAGDATPAKAIVASSAAAGTHYENDFCNDDWLDGNEWLLDMGDEYHWNSGDNDPIFNECGAINDVDVCHLHKKSRQH